MMKKVRKKIKTNWPSGGR